jgi:hypothetical protein
MGFSMNIFGAIFHYFHKFRIICLFYSAKAKTFISNFGFLRNTSETSAAVPFACLHGEIDVAEIGNVDEEKDAVSKGVAECAGEAISESSW